jgi:hypothetical protein
MGILKDVLIKVFLRMTRKKIQKRGKIKRSHTFRRVGKRKSGEKQINRIRVIQACQFS